MAKILGKFCLKKVSSSKEGMEAIIFFAISKQETLLSFPSIPEIFQGVHNRGFSKGPESFSMIIDMAEGRICGLDGSLISFPIV
ncbi:MAG: hypothetical protein QXG08_04575 [Candidatus Methanomethyliaceae archaeon]